jgi:hypothetical protein
MWATQAHSARRPIDEAVGIVEEGHASPPDMTRIVHKDGDRALWGFVWGVVGCATVVMAACFAVVPLMQVPPDASGSAAMSIANSAPVRPPKSGESRPLAQKAEPVLPMADIKPLRPAVAKVAPGQKPSLAAPAPKVVASFRNENVIEGEHARSVPEGAFDDLFAQPQPKSSGQGVRNPEIAGQSLLPVRLEPSKAPPALNKSASRPPVLLAAHITPTEPELVPAPSTNEAAEATTALLAFEEIAPPRLPRPRPANPEIAVAVQDGELSRPEAEDAASAPVAVAALLEPESRNNPDRSPAPVTTEALALPVALLPVRPAKSN